ncbi:glycine-rich domain-containing protein [Chitinolyticbacter meiyuanensis]|uniref:glycine-rich domain-containing protein n=1 Tax=Chitinolyticbacter meiyuanensis TaxID=682798 RepID=UPI0016525764|nr:hypothetical protein [Chitinolyticbacter meiyuanensis]
MANLNEPPVPGFPGVYQLELTDRVKGGAGGTANRQAEQLVERTAHLKQRADAGDAALVAHATADDPHPAYWNNTRGDAKIAAAIAALVAASPSTLDTLAELATALGNDPNFSTTILNALAGKSAITGIQTQAYSAFATTGAAPSFALTPAPGLAAYAAGQRFRVKFHAAGTTGSNLLNISGLGTKSLMQYDANGNKVAATIKAAQLADVEYDGADMVVLDALPANTIPGNAQVFTASGSFTVPAGVTRVMVECWGGGGGGGATDVVSGSGGGGGAGGYGRGLYAVTPGQVIAVTIGSGGFGAAAGSTAGAGVGGTSSFGSMLSCTGGGGGVSHYSGANGGPGGTPVGHNAGGWSGQNGTSGVYSSGPIITASGYSVSGGSGGGPAGGAGCGGGGGSPSGVSGQARAGGIGSGGGGAAGRDGGNSYTPGAAGGPGMVVVYW